MSEQKEITIYDIAEKLKISAATVSRGLKGNTAISEKTRKKILDKAKEMGYRSNNFASNLRKNKTHTIGVLMHELNSTFMLSVLTGIEQVIGETDYDILIAHSAESGVKEVANAHNLFHKRVDGLIASLALDTPNLDHFEEFHKKNIPVIFFDRVEENNGGTKVIINNYKAGYDATKHLIDQGCKRIAHITGNLKRNVYNLRHKGYMAALQDHKIKLNEKLVFVNNLDRENCVQAAKQLLAMKQPPDGLFVTNDFSAAICMQIFKEAGVNVPADIAVVGFNNDAISSLIEPKLTTINYSGHNVGATAARVLINHLKGVIDITQTNTIVLNSELIVRDSSMKSL
ncbi:LacI family DNA-binding transcriptional regulator [Aridibaculum aurantiacum]|uniref:LacI family DNA-binding transcriptional regulator n=1 Tax=Aridibaculum aurantiacum TaxID=2810307 RepID=UPI001A964416|nr:LacI family DNA-binding transcriptional regulator [Aridibaculum aurantiacum]